MSKLQSQIALQCLTIPEALAYLRVGRTLLYRLIASADIKPIKVGSKATRITCTELDRYLTAQRKAA